MVCFRSADITNRGSITFNEYVHIFAICDMNTPHVGRSAELRCRYIFRFFDADKDGMLNANEFKALILHIRYVKKQPIEESVLREELETYNV